MRKEEESNNDATPVATEGKRVEIEHIFPEGQRTLFANHIVVQRTEEGEFVVSFFDVVKPVLLGEQEDVDERLEKLDSVPAHCLARLAISENRLPKFISAMVSMYDAHIASQGQEQDKPNQEEKKHAS